MKKCALCGIQKSSSSDIVLHRLPKHENDRNIWFKAINKKLPVSALICSNHFKETDYIASYLQRKRLKHDAVPSQFYGNISVRNLNDLQNDKSLNNSSGKDQDVDSTSEEELYCIYYLDENQNVQVIKSSKRPVYSTHTSNFRGLNYAISSSDTETS